MSDSLDELLHGALQRKRVESAGEEPAFAAILGQARDAAKEPRPSVRLPLRWLVPSAAAVVASFIFVQGLSVSPRRPLSGLMTEIVTEHQRQAGQVFGQWTAPSDSLEQPFPPQP